MNAKERASLITTLQLRFEANTHLHQGVTWSNVLTKLEGNANTLRSLSDMETTGGEPDVVMLGDNSDSITFCDCAAESPVGRRSYCYDRAALDARKENKPTHSAVEKAEEMGIELLNEEQYRTLQQLGTFDTKTSSWISTPENIRALGGALFGDRRFDTVFLYHNGASSYYAGRGFRGLLRV